MQFKKRKSTFGGEALLVKQRTFELMTNHIDCMAGEINGLAYFTRFSEIVPFIKTGWFRQSISTPYFNNET